MSVSICPDPKIDSDQSAHMESNGVVEPGIAQVRTAVNLTHDPLWMIPCGSTASSSQVHVMLAASNLL